MNFICIANFDSLPGEGMRCFILSFPPANLLYLFAVPTQDPLDCQYVCCLANFFFSVKKKKSSYPITMLAYHHRRKKQIIYCVVDSDGDEEIEFY